MHPVKMDGMESFVATFFYDSLLERSSPPGAIYLWSLPGIPWNHANQQESDPVRQILYEEEPCTP
jgi:hypothetical protein